jgi:hypothetical protein
VEKSEAETVISGYQIEPLRPKRIAACTLERILAVPARQVPARVDRGFSLTTKR